jgi:hypothetical protein
VKTISQWIQNEPKKKWCTMFDEGGARHRIKTTNFAEVYNCVLRGSRPLPLMGIISSLCIIQCNIFTKGARQRMWF